MDVAELVAASGARDLMTLWAEAGHAHAHRPGRGPRRRRVHPDDPSLAVGDLDVLADGVSEGLDQLISRGRSWERAAAG